MNESSLPDACGVVPADRQCEHEWGDEYHLHLGHELYGAHSKHRDCLKCEWTWTRSRGAADSIRDLRYAKPYWKPLPVPHRCHAGWRGVSFLNEEFTGEPTMHPEDARAVPVDSELTPDRPDWFEFAEKMAAAAGPEVSKQTLVLAGIQFGAQLPRPPADSEPRLPDPNVTCARCGKPALTTEGGHHRPPDEPPCAGCLDHKFAPPVPAPRLDEQVKAAREVVLQTVSCWPQAPEPALLAQWEREVKGALLALEAAVRREADEEHERLLMDVFNDGQEMGEQMFAAIARAEAAEHALRRIAFDDETAYLACSDAPHCNAAPHAADCAVGIARAALSNEPAEGGPLLADEPAEPRCATCVEMGFGDGYGHAQRDAWWRENGLASHPFVDRSVMPLGVRAGEAAAEPAEDDADMQPGPPCGICGEPQYEPITPWKSNGHSAEDGHEWVPAEAGVPEEDANGD